jgi:putative protease
MKNKFELLAPAGNFANLVAAVNAGAGAVYFGMKEFSMRAGAKNFEIKDFPKIAEICKSKKVKMYLTINTIIYNNEIPKIKKLLEKAKPFIDAIICWDFAVIQLCKKFKIPFFISTQASVANVESAKFFKKLGAKRIVLAREVPIEEIKKISKIIDVEVFAHGAMCVAISGRCFTSQFLFGKSANKGQCIHPCRRSYIVKDKQEGYELEIENDKIFSAKDLCTLPFIDKLKKVGVKGFKIEGRNRDARYVDIVTRIYRKALDKNLNDNEIKNFVNKLKKVYNKGFSTGFYLHKPGPDDFAKVEHSASSHRKEFAGKIAHYYPKIKVAEIELIQSLAVGDEIAIIGNTTGIEKTKLKSIQINKKSLKKANRGDKIGIKVPSRVRKNDEVYKIVGNK